MENFKLFFKHYGITDNGIIFNSNTQKELKPYKHMDGYYKTSIEKKNYYVHRLVATFYVPNPDNKPQVDHIDGDKSNNHYTNLRWVTPSENKSNSKRYKKISYTDKLKASAMICLGESLANVSRKLSINYRQVFEIKKKITNKI